MEPVIAAARCRPLTKAEELAGHTNAIEILPDMKQVIVSNERAFTLNHVYPAEASQDQVFEELVDPVVEKVMQGFNACVMAYGQTGSGKTFTMGTKAKAATPGVVQNALQKIFASTHEYEVRVSFLEIYKEEVLDLLSSEKRKLPVMDFKPKGLTLLNTINVDSALAAMEKGLKNRHVGATNANLHSSRSHAVFTIHFTKTTSDGQCTSKLYLVDLAGSESVSDMSGNTKREGVMINKGLLQLGIVMSALSSAGQDHIPYRSSALTSILKDTLSPQNFLVLIACISPLDADITMTMNSLSFASRVGSIKSNPEAGQVIKPRAPITTPFKIPGCYKKRVNSTIATPGSQIKVRPALRPLNNTIDSPRTPHVQGTKKQYWPTSTPFHSVVKPLFADPTPIVKGGTAPSRAVKRRNSLEWDTLDVSTSTVLDDATPQAKNQSQASLVPSSENETWLRSIIADVIREELRGHTLLSQTHRHDGPSPTKKPRRSIRLSKKLESSSFFDHESDATIIASSPNHENPKSNSDDLKIPSFTSIQKSVQSVINADASLSVAGNKSLRLDTSLTSAPVRRSTRLSVAPRPVYYESPKKNETLRDMKKPKPTKKATRFSTRLSVLPQSTPEMVQKNLNDLVLDILKLGDLKKLQSLPTIGPKTAVIIHNHRLLHGAIESFNDLKDIKGLSANFTKRFLWANNIVLQEEENEDGK